MLKQKKNQSYPVKSVQEICDYEETTIPKLKKASVCSLCQYFLIVLLSAESLIPSWLIDLGFELLCLTLSSPLNSVWKLEREIFKFFYF